MEIKEEGLKFNKEQKEAIEHGKGSLLIVAGAGTGKTAVLTKKIAHLIMDKKVAPGDILALTFTEKAAQEMEERVDIMLPFGYYDLWISTFHSFCEKILKEYGLSIGLSTNFKLLDETGGWILVRKNFDKFGFLDYYRPLGNSTKFIHALLSHFKKLKNENISPQDYLEYADSLKSELDDAPGISRSLKGKEKIEAQRKEEEYKKIKEAAQAYHAYQKLLLDNNALDFGDLLIYTLKLFKERPLILEKYRQQFKYILVDEFQDTNWAQYELLKILASPKNNITVCADDDQCLPGEMLVEKWEDEKIRQVKIRNIKKGDILLTGVGRGHLGLSKINNVFKNKKKTEFITVTTKRGNKVTVTDNHKMFSMVPLTSKKGHHYVYLMYRKDIGWRIGKTDDLVLRLRLERSADKIIALRSYGSDGEARYHETLWSLKYGIPTGCFCERKGVVIKDELLVDLYKEIDVDKNVSKLANDLNIDLDYCHHCLEGVNRGKKERIKINILMCLRSYRSKEAVKKGRTVLRNPLIRHSLRVETSSKYVINEIEKAGFAMAKAKKGKRVLIVSGDIKELMAAAKKIQEVTGGFIESKFYAGVGLDSKTKIRHNHPALIMPAKNLAVGHYLPVRRDNTIIYDEIVKIEKEIKNDYVYDLEVDKTHNFLAQGIVVHNSIYSFQGASFNNVLQFKKDFSGSDDIVLVKNYRSPQNILDLAYDFIQLNNPNRLEFRLNESQELKEQAKKKGVSLSGFKKIDKKLKSADKEQGTIEHLVFESGYEEIDGIISRIWKLKETDKQSSFSDFVVLVRTNEIANSFARGFERSGLPYQFLASKGLYLKPLILDLVSYLKVLADPSDSASFYRVLTMPVLDISASDIPKIIQYAYQKAIPVAKAIDQLSLIKDVGQETVSKVNSLAAQVRKHAAFAKEKNVSELFVMIIHDLGFAKYFGQDGEKSFQDSELASQFHRKLKNFEDGNVDTKLFSFLEEFKMEMEAGEEGSLSFSLEDGSESVKIMTVHSAKGLEFKYVFIANVADRRFPNSGRSDPISIPGPLIKEVLPEGDFHLQEERRLFYVGVTRAKKKLFLTWAKDYGGKTLKKPSRFLFEAGLVKDREDFSRTESKKFGFSLEKDNIAKAKPKTGKSFVFPGYFSFTQLSTFDKCPLQYKFSYLLKIPSKGKPALSFGKTMHNTLYRFLMLSSKISQSSQIDLFGGKGPAAGKGAKVGYDDLVKIYKEEWIEDWYEDDKQKKDYFKQGEKSLKEFFEQHTQNKPQILFLNGSPALEQDFKLKVGEDIFIGKIDRVDKNGNDSIEILDYKTGKPNTNKSLMPSDKLQLLVYHLALKSVFGISAQKLTYHYLNNCSMVSFMPKDEESESTEAEIAKRIANLKQSDFAPKPGFPQCNYCDFKEICPYRKVS
ncbi:MAG: UvrD-helicase domain-containing protein [Candidatus Paceibacterota bacterium]|jgi:DNA helicase-2/ATP-dependent DNA helicase PcrA